MLKSIAISDDILFSGLHAQENNTPKTKKK
jgi:hypothetical protein